MGINLFCRYETGLKLHIRSPLGTEASEEEILETVVTATTAGAARTMMRGKNVSGGTKKGGRYETG